MSEVVSATSYCRPVVDGGAGEEELVALATGSQDPLRECDTRRWFGCGEQDGVAHRLHQAIRAFSARFGQRRESHRDIRGLLVTVSLGQGCEASQVDHHER